MPPCSALRSLLGDRDRGGQISENKGGGVKILNFQGPLKLAPQRFIEDRQFGGQKSKVSRGNFRGEFPLPPLTLSTFCPYPSFQVYQGWSLGDPFNGILRQYSWDNPL